MSGLGPRSARARFGAMVVAVTAAVALSGLPRTASATGAGTWQYGGDLVPQPAVSNNGGPSHTSSQSSKFGAVPEECSRNPPVGTQACGRGEFGGPTGFSETLLDNLDSETGSEHFACPSSASSTTPAAGTTTGTTTGTPPALLLLPGVDVGGKQSNSANYSGETECYDPYQEGASAALAGAAAPGAVYRAAPTTSCAVASPNECTARNLGEVIYVPPALPGGVLAALSCGGKVLYTGGGSKTSEYYDPDPAHSTFNTWRAGPSAGRNHVEAPIARLKDGRFLIAGGYSGGPENSYEIFDPGNCKFASISTTMVSARYDFGMSEFADGRVLACGGSIDTAFDFTNTCELFDPNLGPTYLITLTNGTTVTRHIGQWSAVAPMAAVRSGHISAPMANGHVLMAGGTNNNNSFQPLDTSEECDESGCGLDQTTYANDPSLNGQQTTPPMDASLQVVGQVPGSTAATFKNLVFECGGFGGSVGGPPRTCEYYLPAGMTSPSVTALTCSAAAGPAWCAGSGIDMQRQRAYFLLQEVPPGPTVPDEIIAMGGFYGTDSHGNYLTRKNVEFLAES